MADIPSPAPQVINSPNDALSWTSLPARTVLSLPNWNMDYPEYPFQYKTDFLVNKFYPATMQAATPLLFAVTYFVSVHLLNGVVRNRQERAFLAKNPGKSLPDKLPGAPYSISKLTIFKIFVFLHNVVLCVYSVLTFVGMLSSLRLSISEILPGLVAEASDGQTPQTGLVFWQSVCDANNGVWKNRGAMAKGLSALGYLFYLSKFYEILDTMIILLKGRQAALLQSYHHAGAILCMWAGIRFISPPIWIFVVFNSFIHSIMYFYFTLSCLHIRVPLGFKQALTSLQIVQFVVGGSLALVHLFVQYMDLVTGTAVNCINSGEEALAIFANVAYLTPLTMLFGIFYLESYKKKAVAKKKTE